MYHLNVFHHISLFYLLFTLGTNKFTKENVAIKYNWVKNSDMPKEIISHQNVSDAVKNTVYKDS